MPKQISQNQTVLFDTHLCQDADRNQPPVHPTVNMWHFGDNAKPYDDVRTDNSNISSAITHQFTEAGVCNVTLMNVDVNSGLPIQQQFHASHLAAQQITVRPAMPGVYLIFNIKDTYLGTHLTPHAYGMNPTTNHGVFNAQTDMPDNIETRFVKYAKINNTIVWQDDIAGDEGWQHVVINIGNQTPIYGNSADVEIGLMAVTDASGHGPDAKIVKGVAVYIDDVYINNPDGTNALKNGDFETSKSYPTDPHDAADVLPAAWTRLDEGYNTVTGQSLMYYDRLCWHPGGNFTRTNKGSGLSSDDVHSGLIAYKGWVQPFNDDYTEAFYETNRYYSAPGRYKAVTQRYKWGSAAAKEPFTLYVMPNPSLSGSTLHIYCTGSGYESQSKILTVYSAQGNDVVKTEFAGEEYTLKQNLKAGVYIVGIECDGKEERKKLVITN